MLWSDDIQVEELFRRATVELMLWSNNIQQFKLRECLSQCLSPQTQSIEFRLTKFDDDVLLTFFELNR